MIGLPIVNGGVFTFQHVRGFVPQSGTSLALDQLSSHAALKRFLKEEEEKYPVSFLEEPFSGAN